MLIRGVNCNYPQMTSNCHDCNRKQLTHEKKMSIHKCSLLSNSTPIATDMCHGTMNPKYHHRLASHGFLRNLCHFLKMSHNVCDSRCDLWQKNWHLSWKFQENDWLFGPRRSSCYLIQIWDNSHKNETNRSTSMTDPRWPSFLCTCLKGLCECVSLRWPVCFVVEPLVLDIPSSTGDPNWGETVSQYDLLS